MIKRQKVFENNCFLILARREIITFVFFINVFINLKLNLCRILIQHKRAAGKVASGRILFLHKGDAFET